MVTTITLFKIYFSLIRVLKVEKKKLIVTSFFCLDFFHVGKLEMSNIAMKYFSVFNDKPPASWVAHITRDFFSCYSCWYYSFLLQYKTNIVCRVFGVELVQSQSQPLNSRIWMIKSAFESNQTISKPCFWGWNIAFQLKNNNQLQCLLCFDETSKTLIYPGSEELFKLF